MLGCEMALKRFLRACLPLSALGLPLVLGGCSYFSAKAKEDVKIIESSSAELILHLDIDKSVYRPGEALVAQVSVTNTTNQAMKVRILTAITGPPQSVPGAVSFWFGPEDNSRRIQRYPVVSKLEINSRTGDDSQPMDLAAGQTISRPFLLTQMTREQGRFFAQAHMAPFDQSDSMGKRIGKIYSNQSSYVVYGDPLFDRDNQGLVFEEEAINVAAAATPGDILLADAMLVEDDMGFLKWWVNVDYLEPAGTTKKTAYLVDPYQGRILSKARPFDPATNPRNTSQGFSQGRKAPQIGVLRPNPSQP